MASTPHGRGWAVFTGWRGEHVERVDEADVFADDNEAMHAVAEQHNEMRRYLRGLQRATKGSRPYTIINRAELAALLKRVK